MMTDRGLPEPFQVLEHFVNTWSLATATERNRKRLTSPMNEIQAFYDALLPRMEAVLTYLSQFPLEPRDEEAGILPGEARRPSL